LLTSTSNRAHAYIDELPPNFLEEIEATTRLLSDSLSQDDKISGLETLSSHLALNGILPATNKTHTDEMHFQDLHDAAQLSIPESWVRGAILIRCNSLLRRHSQVRLEVIEMLLRLLSHDLVPLVPLRGNAASYIAAVVEGNVNARVWSGARTSRTLLSADQALKSIGVKPISLGVLEALAFFSGTAFSLSVATIAQHRADILAVLAQILTAMGVEASLGTVESFHPFIGSVRPHKGQIEVDLNIRGFLKGSKLASIREISGSLSGELKQNKCAFTTSSQCLGPALEDLGLARQQIEIELNSTSDKILVDVANSQIHNSGNSQASPIISMTEKTSLSLEKIGRLLFSHSTELPDADLGTSINMAGYASELSYIAHPVGTHGVSAKMPDQAINDLAFIGARATLEAIEVLSMMSSAYLYAICQALDLRVMNEQFLAKLKPEIQKFTAVKVGRTFSEGHLMSLQASIWSTILHALSEKTSKGTSSSSFPAVAQSAQHHIVNALTEDPNSSGELQSGDCISLIASWAQEAALIMQKIFVANRETYFANPNASDYLGSASARMYNYIRRELKVPMHRGLVQSRRLEISDGSNRQTRLTAGSDISRLYQALKDERLVVPIMRCLTDTVEERKKQKAGGSKL
jgi:phenylalanine ammonia-lyase